MTPQEFVANWKNSDLNEKSGAQLHFLGLCKLLGVDPPLGASSADGYGFEINVDKVGGGQGYADAWKRGCFAWEYKSPGANLGEALKQLKLYASDLENPPLLIVSDMRRIEIHTNWTNMVQEKHVLELDDLVDARWRQKLKWAFNHDTVQELKPSRSANATTEEVAENFVQLAQSLRDRGHDPEKVAHFVNRMVFCMFAEDVDLLPKKLFQRMLEASLLKPEEFARNAQSLFAAMAKRDGLVGFDRIPWFNGGLFEDDEALPLTREEIRIALNAAQQDWSEINPSIMGTLFERGLDPSKRSQLGAHYTDAEKIMMIIRPVITEPLLREWGDVLASIELQFAKAKKAKAARPTVQADAARFYQGQRQREENARREARRLMDGWIERLKNFRVLDPACGSGNFLYLALKSLKDIELRTNYEFENLSQYYDMPIGLFAPSVGPECVKGIEINSFAAELARVSVWIGEIQWMRKNNFGVSDNPILKPLATIECRDALLTADGQEASWPQADVIVGNPPFLGDKRMIGAMGERAVEQIRSAFRARVPGGADLVCYWFEKVRSIMFVDKSVRAGLVATNSIRFGANRYVLDRLASEARISNAWSDEEWSLDGAKVRVSIICLSGNMTVAPMLDGVQVDCISPSLTSSAFDTSKLSALSENRNISFTGVFLNGQFEVESETARAWLMLPKNVNGKHNSLVLKRSMNGFDLLQRGDEKWVVDFGTSMDREAAAFFEEPFKYVQRHVLPYRQRKGADGEFEVRRTNHRDIWWRYAEARPGMRSALEPLERFIVTPMVSSTRVFCFLEKSFLANQKLVVFARDDLTFFGILQSVVHRIWTLKTCSWIGSGNDPTYATSSVFETFPFPEGLTPNISAALYSAGARAQAVAAAAATLNELRQAWLNPPELVKCLPEVVPGYPDRVLPIDDKAAALLKNRTLTKLYNERPAWLDNAHRELDSAVAAAYGWTDWDAGLSDDVILARLFKLNQERAAKQ